MNKKRLILFDAHAILHRAFHALPDFSSSKGEPTGALYGLSTMIIKIMADLKPDYVAACFDLAGPTHRHEVYDKYKAQRKKTPDELVLQMDRARDVFSAFAIPCYEMAGFEADDLLGTIVERLKDRKDIEIIIASGDMDTMQLITGKQVQVYTLKKGIQDTILYDEDAVLARFGFGPELLPDYKGLRGDPSDNIIGISGIGEKTATILITAFGTIEAMYKTLKKDEKKFIAAGVKPRIIELLKNGEEEAEFSKMLATIRRDAHISFSLPEKVWKESVSMTVIEKLFSELEFRTLSARVQAVIDGKPSPVRATMEKKPDQQTLVNTEPDEIFKEAAVAFWLIQSHNTEPTRQDILLFTKTSSLREALPILKTELTKRNLTKVFEDIELPLIPIVAAMESHGIRLDLKKLSELSKVYGAQLRSIEKKIFTMAGEEFNIASPKQLGVVLFEKMGLTLKRHKKTEGGAKSTKESELEKMQDLHPIISEILKHRELSKLLGTYIDALPNSIGKDGRLHARFLQAGSTTGRMASKDPNLQNIPNKTELGRKIREAFVATEGFELVAFDYSQFELRIAAFLSGDPKLIAIFKNKEDIHTAVAAEVFKVPLDTVDKEMRRQAKVINFGIIYGMGVNALAQNLGADRKTAQQFYNAYFERFRTLASYLDKVKAETARRGYTETFFGRRRYFEGIHSSVPYIKAAAERMAINAPIQGTEADLIKLAMVEVDRFIKKNKLDESAYLLLQVHDELVYEIRSEKIPQLVPTIIHCMQTQLRPEQMLGVPIEVHASRGKNWGSMEPL